MSVVVILRDKYNGNFVLAADTEVTYGSVLYHGAKKIHQFSSGLIVGVVGDLRVTNLLFNNQEIFSPLIKEGKFDREYLVKDFSKNLFEYLKEYFNDSTPRDDSGRDKSITCYTDIIIAYKKEAFHLFSNYSILEIENYDAIGIGSEASITCLEALDKYSKLPSYEIAAETIKIVSKNIEGIDSTVNIIAF